MSAQYGQWNFDGPPPTPSHLDKVGTLLRPYGPDGQGAFRDLDIAMLYFPFHTTMESRRETQPHVSSSGSVFIWDGRLDNRTELRQELGKGPRNDLTDIAVVAEAFERWGTASFEKLIGDWALSVWEPRKQRLLLAKDFLGTRPLYYACDNGRVSWSTVLDPLVLLARKPFTLCREYLAGWFVSFPATHLTPYEGIQAVPPACFVAFARKKQTIHLHTHFNSRVKIRYHSDREYEEHFRTVFLEAVRRRLRSDGPLLAELSGGMDSSSIVCAADVLVAAAGEDSPCVDTVSYYDDAEPNWNERPYFTLVEQRRGKVGLHLDVTLAANESPEIPDDRPALAPGFVVSQTNASRQLGDYLKSRHIRVVLSGIGGDETTGGAPTPIPELADLLVGGHSRVLARQLKAWALAKRKPWFLLLHETIGSFLPATRKNFLPSWITPKFGKEQRKELGAYRSRLRFLGPAPSFQENMSTLETLRRQLASTPLPLDPIREKRYPFLDRTLLEFLFAVPRDQLARPGERRSLLRRALSGIVPEEILHRRRKAYVSRSPVAALARLRSNFSEPSLEVLADSLGIVDRPEFLSALSRAGDRADSPFIPVLRVFLLERWLRQCFSSGLLQNPVFPRPGGRSLEEQRGRTVEGYQ